MLELDQTFAIEKRLIKSAVRVIRVVGLLQKTQVGAHISGRIQ